MIAGSLSCSMELGRCRNQMHREYVQEAWAGERKGEELEVELDNARMTAMRCWRYMPLPRIYACLPVVANSDSTLPAPTAHVPAQPSDSRCEKSSHVI